MRAPLFIAPLGVLLLLAGGGAWWWLRAPPPDLEDLPPIGTTLPIPPVPPRVAQGRDYEQCLGMLDSDPAAAAAAAIGWEAVGGGDGARHCAALARIALGHAGEGAELLEKLAADSKAATATRAMLLGQASQAWLIEEAPEKAYAAASAALDLLPDDPDLLVARARIAIDLGRHADAVADLTRALAADPDRVETIALRASARRLLGDTDAAMADVIRALTLDPEAPEALLERGILRQRRGDDDGARQDWERVIDLAPDSPEADLAEQNLALLDAGPASR